MPDESSAVPSVSSALREPSACAPLRVAVLSSTRFGLRCLSQGIEGLPDVQVVGILTTPRDINISYSGRPVEIRTHADFSDFGRRTGCDVVVLGTPVRPGDYLPHLDRWKPDLLLALGWYYNVPRPVRERAPLGCAGIHASLLPNYRGGAPVTWAIINGETESGVTFFYLTDEIDAGDVIAQASYAIDPQDTCATVYEKAERASVAVLRQYLPGLADGTAPRIPQDHGRATHFPQRKPEDGLIDWSWSAGRIQDFIRAQTRPYPGAYFFAGRHKVTIWDATVQEVSGDPSEDLR